MRGLPFASVLGFLPALLLVMVVAHPSEAQLSPEARIHPPVVLLDSAGQNVLVTGGPVSTLNTCGECHDVDFISTHSLHGGPGLLAAAPPPWAASSRPWAPPTPEGAEMNCFLCHTSRPANQARVDALEAGLGSWAATATLENSGIVTRKDGGWHWEPAAFDSDGRALDTLLALRGPTSENCGQCHGIAGDDMGAPVTLSGMQSGSLLTLTRGEIFSPQKISHSGVNLVGKESLGRAWDAHAERLLECSNCHFSNNNPIYRKEPEATQPLGLLFDSRRMPLGAYLQRPSHNFAGETVRMGYAPSTDPLTCESCHDPEPTHEWLPYAKRHMDALACEVCHSPMLYSVAVESVDWTSLNGRGEPTVTWRGCAAGCETAATDLVRGVKPAILAREDQDGRIRLAPYNLVTSWYWVWGAESEPVDLDLVTSALEAGSGGGNGVGVEAEVAARLEALGLDDPRIIGEINPYPIHHGVAGEGWATRDCQSCHDENSQLAEAVVLAPGAPNGVIPTLVRGSEGVLLGTPGLDETGRLVYSPTTSVAGLYVLGHDAVHWANLLGILVILATLLGVAVHGGLRWWGARNRSSDDTGPEPNIYMYRTYERVWHWLQALAIMVLLLTGIEIHVASTGLMDFAVAVRVHNILGFIVLANAVFAAFYHVASGEIRHYLPEPKGFFGQAFTQARFYLSGIFSGEAHPFDKSPTRKLNPLQQVTYLGILNILLPLQIVTGVLIWGVQRWPAVDGWLGGLTFLAPLHALGAWLFAAFLLVHVYLTTTGPTPTANLRAMVDGWEAIEASERRSEVL